MTKSRHDYVNNKHGETIKARIIYFAASKIIRVEYLKSISTNIHFNKIIKTALLIFGTLFY